MTDDTKENENVKKALELLKKGHNSDDLIYKSRDELYDRWDNTH